MDSGSRPEIIRDLAGMTQGRLVRHWKVDGQDNTMYKKMKLSQNNTILLFTSEYPPHIGGVASYYRDLVAAWNIRGESTINVVKATLKPHWLFDGFRLWRAVRTHRPQIVLAGQLLPVGTVTWLLSKIMRYKYGVFVHGMDLPYALAHSRKRWLVRRIIQDAFVVIAVNSYVHRLLVEMDATIASKITVVNPGVDARAKDVDTKKCRNIIEKYNLQGKKILLQVGRLVKRKGVDMVLAALPRVVEQCDDVVYCIVGNGEEMHNVKREMSREAGSRHSNKIEAGQNDNLKGRVLLITDARDDEVNAWYELCDIFIMPARQIGGDFEGFGIVYLEANAHGKPVIAGDSGGVRDAVVDGVNGVLVDPKNVDAIADAIVKLCNDEDLRKQLGERGRERVKEFSWEKQVGKLKKILDL